MSQNCSAMKECSSVGFVEESLIYKTEQSDSQIHLNILKKSRWNIVQDQRNDTFCFQGKYCIQCSNEIYSKYSCVSEKPPARFCRADFPLQNLPSHISPQYNRFEIYYSTFHITDQVKVPFNLVQYFDYYIVIYKWNSKNFFTKRISEKSSTKLL